MMTPTLETSRLVLRPFVPCDWDAINAMLSDSEAMQHMHFTSWNEDQRRKWFDACVELGKQPNPDGLGWAIERQENCEVIGWFGIGTSSDPTTDYDISFGYALARASWNQGYMTEVLRAVFAYEFKTLGAPQLKANSRAANPASARVMEKVGMRLEKFDYGADFEGNWAHRSHYIITRAEYESQD